jgi:hypothetical protein
MAVAETLFPRARSTPRMRVACVVERGSGAGRRKGRRLPCGRTRTGPTRYGENRDTLTLPKHSHQSGAATACILAVNRDTYYFAIRGPVTPLPDAPGGRNALRSHSSTRVRLCAPGCLDASPTLKRRTPDPGSCRPKLDDLRRPAAAAAPRPQRPQRLRRRLPHAAGAPCATRPLARRRRPPAGRRPRRACRERRARAAAAAQGGAAHSRACAPVTRAGRGPTAARWPAPWRTPRAPRVPRPGCAWRALTATSATRPPRWLPRRRLAAAAQGRPWTAAAVPCACHARCTTPRAARATPPHAARAPTRNCGVPPAAGRVRWTPGGRRRPRRRPAPRAAPWRRTLTRPISGRRVVRRQRRRRLARRTPPPPSPACARTSWLHQRQGRGNDDGVRRACGGQ